jgi:hypothetical protein
MHRVGLIVPDGFQLLSLAPMTAFEMTGFGLAKPTASLLCGVLHHEVHHCGILFSYRRAA